MYTEDQLRAELKSQLIEAHGPLVCGAALAKLLGFPTVGALNQAVRRKRLGIRTFKLPGRPGKCALTLELVEFFIANHGARATRASKRGLHE